MYPEKPFRLDYEVPVKAVVDYALLRDDVDEERLAMVGFSLGGYFASRAAIYEKRIKACVVDSPIIDISRYYGGFGNLEELAKIKEEDYNELFPENPFIRWAVETFTRCYETQFCLVYHILRKFVIICIYNNPSQFLRYHCR